MKIERKPINPADLEIMQDLAKKLFRTPDPDQRMAMQQRFVKEMTPRYGHERATKMLTQVWRMPRSI